ncbi:MAG: hypothetical protein CVT74_10310 [Alphaproteobacteria bacterium HGW-Alphaproteobacteria-13]|jgi:hypothetical protein|nr:MAG: hypothetical protein CVT74_10310 [Alphaproteobacteria bacterium HGW-Alphaproteobacteria-13]
MDDSLKAICAHVFERIISTAMAVHRERRVDRSDVLFDTHLGSALAERAIAARDSAGTLRMTTAVLLSHCGYDAALMFVVKLTDRGHFFDITTESDGAIRCETPGKRAFGTADIHDIARRCAQRGDRTREAGPFRGPAQTLWDAGYAGAPRTSRQVEQAEDALARRVLGTWSHIRPPEQEPAA